MRKHVFFVWLMGCLMSLLMLACMLDTAEAAQQRAAMRIARLPVTAEYRYMQPDAATVDNLEDKLDQAFHVPLNGVLNAVEFVPDDEVEKAYDAVMDDLKANSKKKRVHLEDAMQPLAEKLDADLVVCPIVANYEEYESFGWIWSDGPILHSYVTMEIVGYDRLDGKSFDSMRSDSYNDSYSPYGRASYLINNCMDEVLREVDLHARVMKWKDYAKQKQN